MITLILLPFWRLIRVTFSSDALPNRLCCEPAAAVCRPTLSSVSTKHRLLNSAYSPVMAA